MYYLLALYFAFLMKYIRSVGPWRPSSNTIFPCEYWETISKNCTPIEIKELEVFAKTTKLSKNNKEKTEEEKKKIKSKISLLTRHTTN
jgi:hypothetical protein